MERTPLSHHIGLMVSMLSCSLRVLISNLSWFRDHLLLAGSLHQSHLDAGERSTCAEVKRGRMKGLWERIVIGMSGKSD